MNKKQFEQLKTELHADIAAMNSKYLSMLSYEPEVHGETDDLYQLEALFLEMKYTLLIVKPHRD